MDEDPEEEEEYTDEEVLKLLRDAVKEKSQDKRLPTGSQVRQALINTNLEFLTCFKLIGYDLDGNLVSLQCGRNDLHMDAVTHAFLEEFSKLMGSKMK